MKINALSFLGLTVLLSGFVACKTLTQESPPPPIKTDKTEYKAVRNNTSKPAIELTIQTEYTNNTGKTVYLVGCEKPAAPTLQKYVDGRWITAYEPVENQCLRRPWEIRNGQTYKDTYQVRGYIPGNNIAPTFDVPVPGKYRLVREIYSTWSDQPYTSQFLPMHQRVSNEFTITE
ncbi:MAG: hypothetical protein VKL59_04760 [Nostocaceae cyanobacterium]|nr:hypothetical protein [Nostocaceae cyanobacterium]